MSDNEEPKKLQSKEKKPRNRRQPRGNNKSQDNKSAVKRAGEGGPSKSNNNNNDKKAQYRPYEAYEECQEAYATYDTTIVRGRLRVLPSGQDTGSSFVTDDRGTFRKDILVPDAAARNRALDGDTVFIRLDEKPLVEAKQRQQQTDDDDEDEAGDKIVVDWMQTTTDMDDDEKWQDDETQMALWNPVVPIARKAPKVASPKDEVQRQGRVVYVYPPVPLLSEIDPTPVTERTRPLVGYLKILPSGQGLLTPLDKSLPQFKVPSSFTPPENAASDTTTLYRAEYVYGSWEESHKWPPCRNIKKMGEACVLEDEIQALLMQNRVDHGDFPSHVLKEVDEAVQSGLCYENGKMEWKPTPDMYTGRRDYRKERIFTIDPTTAKDLDDALHIKELPDGRIEMGVHIADVSHFVTPGSAVDKEAQRRTTTVYLVDRTVPMLPRPLCEIACSLNENVERLAFSCVWTMNPDGTLGKSPDIWYGRTVIRSCARLDYSTAQNIIENKVGTGETARDMDEAMWPPSRRPDGQFHTVDQVAADVRLMHQGRAVLRHHPEPLEEGLDKVAAVAKAAVGFEMDISSSQTLHESLQRFGRECQDDLVIQCVTQMLMTPMQPANYFAAGTLESALWKHFGLNIPYYTHFTRYVNGYQKYCCCLFLTKSSSIDLLSPIRRYPDVMVHRLLQATLDTDNDWDDFPLPVSDIQRICDHCNEKRMAAKTAQERCDRVFLALFVRANPLQGQLGVVLSVGNSAFTVYVPSLGAAGLLYLQEHQDMLTYQPQEDPDGQRILLLEEVSDRDKKWNRLEIRVFTKLTVTVICQERPPIDIKVRFEGPWRGP
eukprot:scaffold3421_cov181-Amphora_coffeaeformis.AAC.22